MSLNVFALCEPLTPPWWTHPVDRQPGVLDAGIADGRAEADAPAERHVGAIEHGSVGLESRRSQAEQFEGVGAAAFDERTQSMAYEPSGRRGLGVRPAPHWGQGEVGVAKSEIVEVVGDGSPDVLALVAVEEAEDGHSRAAAGDEILCPIP
ncbi:hypothetical protein O3Q52_22750 [Streptomyces sp. ActVer]|uniref:hypothetical protein n=1 Tax=Streptomyces sp. ActVer TaxID=3014558 RepID=UPI0022B55A8B|nr:hypothetical protein [Streptomyces sp. ActVer]MCZ4510958.1 hypothetical protein [Streptomyces sp. ActVer]